MLENKCRESVFDNKTMIAYMITSYPYQVMVLVIDYTGARLHGYAPSLGPSLRAERRCVLRGT